MVDHAHRLRREPMSIARGGRVRASPPSCESITRSRWVGFCYSCASAPSPAGLLCVPWTGKYYRAPRPPFAHRCVPAIAAARDGSPPPRRPLQLLRDARVWPRSAWRARNPWRRRPAGKPAGLGWPHPYPYFGSSQLSGPAHFRCSRGSCGVIRRPLPALSVHAPLPVRRAHG